MILTNGAGGIKTSWLPGTPVLISDHINFTSASPIEGANFVDLTDLYAVRLRDIARTVDASLDEGVYMQFRGPHYETPAEVQMAKAMGAHIVGMSTALEAIARRGDCSAFVIDSFGTADTAVRVLEQAGCAAEAVSLEHAALAVMRSNLVIADALACGPEMFFASAGSYGVAALAHVESVPVWLTARKGTRLPNELWLAMHSRNRDTDQPWRTEVDEIPLALCGTFVGPTGISHVPADAVRPECPATTEMLVRSAM